MHKSSTLPNKAICDLKFFYSSLFIFRFFQPLYEIFEVSVQIVVGPPWWEGKVWLSCPGPGPLDLVIKGRATSRSPVVPWYRCFLPFTISKYICLSLSLPFTYSFPFFRSPLFLSLSSNIDFKIYQIYPQAHPLNWCP